MSNYYNDYLCLLFSGFSAYSVYNNSLLFHFELYPHLVVTNACRNAYTQK